MNMLRLGLLLWFCGSVAASGLRAAEDEFQSLFNGEDLGGWVRVNTPPSTWTVRDGMIVCSGKPIGELRTERMYQNFILELEWRHMRPRGNAGVFVWADDITARGQPFHRGIEVQVLENAYGDTDSHTTHGDIFPIHGATMTPLTGHRRGSRAFPTEKRSKPSPHWNHYRIECRDGEISLAVNGEVVTRGKDCSPRRGYICLESEGGIVHYRNLRIRELPATSIAPEHVATAARGFESLYSGLDLSGWTVPPEQQRDWEPRDWRLGYRGAGADAETGLATTTELGDFGFVVDVRRTAASGITRIFLRSPQAALVIDPDDGSALARAVDSRGWTRLEGTLRGDRLTLSVNGEELFRDREVSGVAARGPLRLVPGGPTEFANIYVRALGEGP